MLKRASSHSDILESLNLSKSVRELRISIPKTANAAAQQELGSGIKGVSVYESASLDPLRHSYGFSTRRKVR